MDILHPGSLADTLDSIHEYHFYEKRIPKTQRIRLAKWIAYRQGIPGADSEMFAPTDSDFKGIRLFTGEKVNSRSAIAHILGVESLRALFILNIETRNVLKSRNQAQEGFQATIRAWKRMKKPVGIYKGGVYAVSLWRMLASSKFEDQDKLIRAGLRELKKHRDDKGKWNAFPYYYTVLVLWEMLKSVHSPRSVITEIKYAKPGLEYIIDRKLPDNKYNHRKKELAERILSVF